MLVPLQEKWTSALVVFGIQLVSCCTQAVQVDSQGMDVILGICTQAWANLKED